MTTRPAITVAATECRRTVRAVTGDRTKLLVMVAIGVLMFGPITAVGGFLLPEAGEQVASGPIDAELVSTAIEMVAGFTALGWLFILLMAAIRTVTSAADVDQPACLLVSTRVRNVVVGVIAAEILLFAIWLVPPAVIFAAAFAYGAGTAVPVLIAPFVVGLVLVTAVPVGFVVGILFRHLITVYEPIARYRTHILAALALAYFGSIAVGWFDNVAAVLFDHLGESPLGWLGHVLLLGIPNVTPSTSAVIGAIIGTALVLPAAVAVAIVAANVHWFADPARTEDATTTTESSNRLAGVLSHGFSRPVRTVTVTAIRRTRRSPIRLAYVAYPLFGAFFFVQDIIQAGTVPTYVAVALCLYVVWGTGALFTLNPLGDLGRTMPAVLTSTLSGRDAIRGRMIAGSLVGVPIAVLVAVAVGLASPLSFEQSGVLVAGTVLGACVTPALAVGVGSAFPRFGSVKVTNNREAVMPSKMAFVVYTVAIMLPAGAAVLLYTDSAELAATIGTTVLSLAPQFDASIEPGTVSVVAWTVLAAGVIAPPVAYRYAIERFDWYTIE